jgi:hypothetical protein
VDGKLWRVLRDLAVKSTSSQGERGPVRSFSLECGSRPRGPLSTLLFDIFIDDLVAGLHDTCSEHGICMGQTDVASLLYADDANALSFTPMACKVDGLHPHLAQQMADARNFTKSRVMVFHPKEENLAACRRRTAGTPGHRRHRH